MAIDPSVRILVVGGAGFIGSHMVKYLKRLGYEVTVLDNLSNGHRDAVRDVHFVEGSVGDSVLLDQLFGKASFGAVMHFAALIEVGPSVSDPATFYQNNLVQTLTLLNAMRKHCVDKLVFSSTAAVYGVPEGAGIREDSPCVPVNPYGNTKYMVERILRDYGSAYGLKSICLRYFNAAGADPEGELGERHDPESHLLPLVLQVASGRRESIKVFGADYATPDGTCIRDFVHVQDLAIAHEKALRRLLEGGESDIFNLGCGTGYSVMEVIEKARQVTGQDIAYDECERRPGDPDILVADISKACKHLEWQPRLSLSDMVKDAWEFEKSQLCVM
ncbi:UDP-glucose 4-epimerase GalE [Modicisalibacter radicis]|uniref:UDP-glucose 4-epimerase GalE n=1 Tax=Halomonas sp. EAR18 TaxID=2518972 RepID=UPI00109D34FD|nr:UDP-glucose 4-epimerase GalE [Halomonas sp. EAR18]